MNYRKYLFLFTTALMFTVNSVYADRDILWRKINENCVTGYLDKDTYQPCSLVDMNRRFTVYKVDNDKYQYLLLPTDKVTGIEDISIQKDGAPNYLYYAWLSRLFLTERLGKPVKERFISLTLNAKNARSQDQFHIHISCLSGPANEVLSAIPENKLNANWSKDKITIPPYSYYYRKVTMNDLMNENLFKSVANKVKEENSNMDFIGVGLVNRGPDNFIMLVGTGTKSRGVSAELIQDHECVLAEQ
ncbi:CDP-diacylglycerol diphosphatase (plasmid) [Escherichia albertii]|uniref:CDP-diacylglycerol diphosphatase n=1 Tax=Escherichia albertii TaxID=208962 RepID=UPI0019586647|nr:CDP-diacylglycerol diphosphatase [Escherichia albertii]QST30891.1 CDP-diacylglycerol diphosphatase [Escherichia albertii]QST40204.1 CDP-diacylglycerol diphosphatase [Escherichia albertii]